MTVLQQQVESMAKRTRGFVRNIMLASGLNQELIDQALDNYESAIENRVLVNRATAKEDGFNG